MRKLALVGLVALLLGLVAGAALAQSISDPSGDVEELGGSLSSRQKHDNDIVGATAGETRKGKLEHTVTVAGKIGHVGDVSLHINLDQDPKEECAAHSTSGLIACGGDPPSQMHVTETSPDTIKFTFSKGAIGSPGKYGWAVETFTQFGGGLAAKDLAPNDGYTVHRLG